MRSTRSPVLYAFATRSCLPLAVETSYCANSTASAHSLTSAAAFSFTLRLYRSYASRSGGLTRRTVACASSSTWSPAARTWSSRRSSCRHSLSAST